MKYLPLAIIAISFFISGFICFSMSSSFSSLDLWVYAPFIISAALSALYISKIFKTHAYGIAGAITCLMVLFPYISAYNYSGTDGQVGLVFAVMPVYQYIGIVVLGFIGHITRSKTNAALGRGKPRPF